MLLIRARSRLAARRREQRRREMTMASMATELRIRDLPKRPAPALERKARRMRLSAGEYAKQLIEDDLALDGKAQTTSLEELA